MNKATYEQNTYMVPFKYSHLFLDLKFRYSNHINIET